MNATHTPTPWAEQEMPGGCNDRITDTDGEGKTICEFPYGLDANSAHIVRCVNAHDDLVAALKAIRDYVAVNERTDDGKATPLAPHKMKAIASVALAKAGAA